MLSRFFIDRPIFATVLSVVVTLLGTIALVYLPVAQYPRITPPGVVVAISYPGANAQVVADTVAAPIEQQVTGVPGMLYMSSQSGNDGSYSLSCTFDVSTNLDAALVLVQNRVTLALPLLPSPVQRQGITIRKRTPDILQIISFTSPNGRYDDVYLSNFALINVRDALLRVDGVSDVNVMGQRDYSIRAWLDPQKLAALGMTAAEVANAVRTQNIEAALGQVGQSPMSRTQAFQMPVDTVGRLSDPARFGEIVVKVGRPPAAPATARAGGSSGSGIADPLRAAVASAGRMNGTGRTIRPPATPAGSTAGGTTISTPPVSTTPARPGAGPSTGGASTVGPASMTDTSSGTTTGGAASAGGGTTGGGATSAAPRLAMAPSSLAVGGASLAAGSLGAIGVASGGGAAAAPPVPSSALVRLRDVARVERGALNYNQSCLFDGKPSVGLLVYQLPGSNALDVADRVKEKMEELSQNFPEDLTYTVGYDTTPFIRESIAEVFHTLFDAVLLVAVVVLLFLQDWKAMILPMIDVPVSLVGTLAVMAALGYSLNNISLFGLVLAIGIVVDDAIVVLENIERQMAKGLEPRAATLAAMGEITGPIVAITVVLCAVFVPCAFISGITGRFFQQFAVTIAASTIISALNALTMTPSRALLILRSQAKGHGHRREALPWWIFGAVGGWLTVRFLPRVLAAPLDLPDPADVPGAMGWAWLAAWFAPGLVAGLAVGWLVIRPVNAALAGFFRAFNAGFETMTTGYAWTIGKAMRVSAVVLVGYAGLLVLTWWLFRTAPTGFVPQQDMGRCLAGVQLPDSAALGRTKEALARIEKIARETPGVAHTIAIAGTSFVLQSNGPNFASLFIILKPFPERQRPELKDLAIMAELRRRWAQEVADARVVVFGAAPIPGVSVAGGFKVIVEDNAGLGVRELQTQTDRLINVLRKERRATGVDPAPLPGDPPGLPPRLLASVSTQFRSRIPQLYMDIDWSKAAALGLSPEDVNQTLQIYLGSMYVNSFNEFGRYWQVTLQAEGQFRSQIPDVSLLQIRNKWGQMVQLGTIAELREVSGPSFVNRYNLYTAAPITGSIQAGIDSGEVIAAVDRVAADTLPRSMRADWTELMFLQIQEGRDTPPSVIFALVVMFVFLALAALYESWTLPLAVILVVPMCLLSSVVGVLAANSSVNLFVQIGLVVLVGLACKNAILIVEFAREKHEAGEPVLEATQDASRQRLRPILMTSFAFILGVVPLLYSSGAGAEMRRSLGVAVFSGMLGVTAFGVLLTPVFFYVIQGFGEVRLFASPAMRWGVSSVFGVMLGATAGYLLGRVGVAPIPWSVPVGGCAGLLGVLAVLGAHSRRREKV